jgi:hypothetical protein
VSWILAPGQDEHLRAVLAEWAASRIPHVGGAGFGPCEALGVMSGEEGDPKSRILAVAVFHEHVYGTVQVSCAADSPRWATPGVLRRLLGYVFEQLECRKMWVAIPLSNGRAIRFNKGIGLRQEATLRQHFGRREPAVVLSMLDHEYRARWVRDAGRDARRAA